jgi:type IV pilus assembly protein PilX
MRAHISRAPAIQRGMALISAMLLLIVVTILAISMFRSYGIQEKIAGNVREKQRALNAAVSAQQYAEWFLTNNGLPATIACPAGFVPTVQICNATINFTTAPWPTGVTFTQFTQNAGNGVVNVVNANASHDTYFQQPTFYITDLGNPAGGGKGEVYQIDAIGYGGNNNAVAVVESTILVSSVNSRWTYK